MIPRQHLTQNQTLNLKENVPLKRLGELARQGKYRYKFNYDKFENGFMCSCQLFYFIRGRKRIIASETRWVETQNLLEAKQTVSALLLENIGLGVEPTTEEELEDDIDMIREGVSGLASEGMRMLSSQLQQTLDSGGEQTPNDLSDLFVKLVPQPDNEHSPTFGDLINSFNSFLPQK